jgi:hypothetical protein
MKCYECRGEDAAPAVTRTPFHVAVRLRGELFHAMTTIPGLGEVSIGSGRNEFQAEDAAAAFLRGNYPHAHPTWKSGRAGNEDGSVCRPRGGYYKD